MNIVAANAVSRGNHPVDEARRSHIRDLPASNPTTLLSIIRAVAGANKNRMAVDVNFSLTEQAVCATNRGEGRLGDRQVSPTAGMTPSPGNLASFLNGSSLSNRASILTDVHLGAGR
jgi:hypothetical protein